MTMAEILLAFAKSVGGFLAAGDNLKRARNKEAACLVQGMADCIKSICDQLAQGKEPVSQCHELLQYAQSAPRALRRAAGFWNGKSVKLLDSALDGAVEAPSRAVLALAARSSVMSQVMRYSSEPPIADTSFENELRKLREAQGLLAAAANLIRSGTGVSSIR